MTDGQFSLVPIEVIQDKRLTLEQMRVLIALFSFRNKVTDTVWPTRSLIAQRTGMHPSNISAATTALVAFGWLKKVGTGGHSKSTRYTLCAPEIEERTVAQPATVAASATVAESATSTVAESATRPVAESATRKEQTNEQTKEQKGKRACARTTPKPSVTRPEDVTERTWTDWIELRKEKRAVVTETVIEGARREARKAGMSLDGFLREWCFRGSQGLKASWLLADRNRQSAGQGETTYQRTMRERMQEAAPCIARPAPGAQPPIEDFFDVQARCIDASRSLEEGA